MTLKTHSLGINIRKPLLRILTYLVLVLGKHHGYGAVSLDDFDLAENEGESVYLPTRAHPESGHVEQLSGGADQSAICALCSEYSHNYCLGCVGRVNLIGCGGIRFFSAALAWARCSFCRDTRDHDVAHAGDYDSGVYPFQADQLARYLPSSYRAFLVWGAVLHFLVTPVLYDHPVRFG